jgi:hypothetical protein
MAFLGRVVELSDDESDDDDNDVSVNYFQRSGCQGCADATLVCDMRFSAHRWRLMWGGCVR